MIHPIQLVRRLRNFPKRPLRSRVEQSYLPRWKRFFPNTPAPIRFRGGLWWTLDMDYVDTSMLNGGYETSETLFISRFAKRGMTVLDIGAHRGLHTIVLSKCVGRHGRVLSFEPSPRNAQRLKLHLKMNFCGNVDVRGCALGDKNGTETLYEVPTNSVLNCLRPPYTELNVVPVSVCVRRLEDTLREGEIGKVDFIKLDVEGAELAVLKGAPQLLIQRPRPVILAEVLDLRTRPWGYPARAIIDHLLQRDFKWFTLTIQGKISPLETESTEFDGNFVAVPKESLQTLTNLCVENNPLAEPRGQIHEHNEAACHSPD